MMNLPLSNNRLNKLATSAGSLSGSGKPNDNALMQVSLSEFLQPLAMAVSQSQPWVDDFGNDQIMLPVDLYEVIKEFARLQPKERTSIDPGESHE